MKPYWFIAFILAAGFACTVRAQDELSSNGIDIGPFILWPAAEAEVGYDDRVLIENEEGVADYYGETSFELRLDKRDALIGMNGRAEYGLRIYGEQQDSSEDFYSASASLYSSDNALQWSVGGSVSKTLDFNASANAETAEGPEGVLTEETSLRYTANANVTYQWQMTERTLLSPYIGGFRNYQSFETEPDAEWDIYSVGCEMAFARTSSTFYTLTADASMQSTSNETGVIYSLEAGTRSRLTDKIMWDVEIGVSQAEYDDSGQSRDISGNLRVVWQVTDKVAFFAFSRHGYEPGYWGRAARKTFRGGYGAGWDITPRWSISAQGVHAVENEISDTGVEQFGEMEHFFNVSMLHAITQRSELNAGVSYADDRFEPNQMVYTVGVRAWL